MTTARDGGAEGLQVGGDNTITTEVDIAHPSEYLRQWTPSPILRTNNESSTVSEKPPSPLESALNGGPKIVFQMATATPSGVTREGLIAALKEKVGATHVEIEDMSGGCGQAYAAVIVSPLFEKKTTLARHRMVNTALKEEVSAIHAWTMKCYTVEQWGKLGVREGAQEAVGEKVEGTSA